jgi:hypothetical protein
MKHVHKAKKELSFSLIEVCDCGQFRYDVDGSFELSKWQLDYGRNYNDKRRCPFKMWLKQRNDWRS